MKKTNAKLLVRRQTLRVLQNTELAVIDGGVAETGETISVTLVRAEKATVPR